MFYWSLGGKEDLWFFLWVEGFCEVLKEERWVRLSVRTRVWLGLVWVLFSF